MGEQTSSKQWNIPMLNARYMCRIVTLKGKSPPGKKGIKLQRIYKKALHG